MNIRHYAVFCSIAAFAFSCATTSKTIKPRATYDCEGKVQQAIKKYNEKKYSNVETIIEEVKYQCSGSAMMDTVYYYMGMAYFKSKKYVEARSEFEKISRDYVNSQYADESQFRGAQSVFLQSNPPDRDQAETKDAIRMLQDFMDSHPSSLFVDSASVCLNLAKDKLAEKEYRNAHFYEKNNEIDAAIVYYRSLISQYPESKFADLSFIDMATDFIAVKRYQEASDVLNDLEGRTKDQAILAKAKELRTKLK